MSSPSADLILQTLWTFVRGDLATSEFERWVYVEPALEAMLGEALYLEAISANYSRAYEVEDLKVALKAFAEDRAPLACQCLTLANLTAVDMGEIKKSVFQTLEQEASRGEPYWWLSVYRCKQCVEWWLVACEERHNDVFLLKRIAQEEARQIVEHDRWPSDFDRYETLLRMGRDLGHTVSYEDPLGSVILADTMADVARQRPGITLGELAELLNLDLDTAEQVARKVVAEEKVRICLERDSLL